MKYNPDYHSSVPRNFRALWKEVFGDPSYSPLVLTDEEIWDISEEWGACESDQFPQIDNRYDACVLCEMDAANTKKIEGTDNG